MFGPHGFDQRVDRAGLAPDDGQRREQPLLLPREVERATSSDDFDRPENPNLHPTRILAAQRRAEKSL
jgi:hypothetical protein